jgi:GNAT superfamily N-acetyltransferase
VDAICVSAVKHQADRKLSPPSRCVTHSPETMHIRPLQLDRSGDAERARLCRRLTDIAHAAKRHWGYPEAWIDLWRDDLTYTPERLERQQTFLAHEGDEILGVLSLSSADPPELEGLWIDPGAIGRGIGTALLAAALEAAREGGAGELVIVADPNAIGFYERAGARQDGWLDSLPPGRRLPRLRLRL